MTGADGRARAATPQRRSGALARPVLVLLACSVGGLAGGGIALAVGAAPVGHALWLAVTALGIASAAWWIVEAARLRRLGVDVVALLALLGTVVVDEHLAGALVTVMLATGRELEARAAARAGRDLSLLVERTPRTARVHREGGLAAVAVGEVRVGDLVVVASGEVVPVDGLAETGPVVLDESALTGESMPRRLLAGERVRSGVVNAGQLFDMRVTVPPGDGTYASIVRLVESARSSTSPVQRLAERYATWFVAASLVASAVAWAASGSPARAVAVLVVATPCPLVLAVPVALVSGLALAARRGVVVKGGGVLEQLARGGTLLLDKTGTLTSGRPVVTDVVCTDGVEPEILLGFAASLDQVSPHVLAAPIVASARARGIALQLPGSVEEVPGSGIRGTVGGTVVALGRAEWLGAQTSEPWLRSVRRRADIDGTSTVFVALDGEMAGAISLEDPVRPDAARTIRNLRRDGFDRIVMVTGDRADSAESVGVVLGVDAVLAERSPEEKVDAVEVERRRAPTVMVGDGINDAPALALADVGVALASRGSSASSEAADVVLTVDRLDRLGEAVLVARRSRAMAREAALVGIGLSVAAMGVAGVGLLTASWGALSQEGIDVVAILVALRALKTGRRRTLAPGDDTLLRHFAQENTALVPLVARIRDVADRLGPDGVALADVEKLRADLGERLEPLQSAEEGQAYPVVARLTGGLDPTGALLRAHAEIRHDLLRLRRLLDAVGGDSPDPGDVLELQRLLYDLHALLRLHVAQERDGYEWLVDAALPHAEGA